MTTLYLDASHYSRGSTRGHLNTPLCPYRDVKEYGYVGTIHSSKTPSDKANVVNSLPPFAHQHTCDRGSIVFLPRVPLLLKKYDIANLNIFDSVFVASHNHTTLTQLYVKSVDLITQTCLITGMFANEFICGDSNARVMVKKEENWYDLGYVLSIADYYQHTPFPGNETPNQLRIGTVSSPHIFNYFSSDLALGPKKKHKHSILAKPNQHSICKENKANQAMNRFAYFFNGSSPEFPCTIICESLHPLIISIRFEFSNGTVLLNANHFSAHCVRVTGYLNGIKSAYSQDYNDNSIRLDEVRRLGNGDKFNTPLDLGAVLNTFFEIMIFSSKPPKPPFNFKIKNKGYRVKFVGDPPWNHSSTWNQNNPVFKLQSVWDLPKKQH